MTELLPVISILPYNVDQINMIGTNWCVGRGGVDVHFYDQNGPVASWLIKERPQAGLIKLMLNGDDPNRKFHSSVSVYVEMQLQRAEPETVADKLEAAISLIFDIQDRKLH